MIEGLYKILIDFKADSFTEDEAMLEIHELVSKTKVLPLDVMNYLAMSGAWLFEMIENDREDIREKLKRMNDALLEKYE